MGGGVLNFSQFERFGVPNPIPSAIIGNKLRLADNHVEETVGKMFRVELARVVCASRTPKDQLIPLVLGSFERGNQRSVEPETRMPECAVNVDGDYPVHQAPLQ